MRDVSFVLEPGETIAVVGHTGAGKTTLISLLMRFYDVQRGAVRIDGVDIKEMNLNDLRSRFGVVLQDPFLFSGTVEGNIRLGTARIQDQDVEQAAEDVNLADFIRSLPGGFKEEVRERGSTLSTGQKQLISFARALAHNPKILILDEATSSVDTETEFRVRDALNRMVEGRTALIIAHRLSTIQRADKIIVMHKGQVREMGSHQQLLAQRGSTTSSTSCNTRIRRSVWSGRPRPLTPRALSLPRYNVPVRILISAGEALGEMCRRAADRSAAQAAASSPAHVETGLGPVPAGQSPTSTQAGQLEFFGAGGERMAAAGCEIVVDAKELAVVSITSGY